MCFSNMVHQNSPAHSKNSSFITSLATDDSHSPILPGLPDDVAKYCLARVSRYNFPSMGGVSKRWRSFIKSKEFITIRKLAGLLEEWLYVLATDAKGKGHHWEVLDHLGCKHHFLPPMPGPVKAGFGVVVLSGSYSMMDRTGCASADVYQFDSCLNRFTFCHHFASVPH